MEGPFLQPSEHSIQPFGKRHEILLEDQATGQHDNADSSPG